MTPRDRAARALALLIWAETTAPQDDVGHGDFLPVADLIVARFEDWLELRHALADLETVGGPALVVQRGLRRTLRILCRRDRASAVEILKSEAPRLDPAVVAAIVCDELAT